MNERFPTITRQLSLEAGIERLPVFMLVTLPLIALIVWVVSLRSATVDHITDLGLITALPSGAFLALFPLILSFGLALYQEKLHVPVLLLHVIVLVFALYGAAMLVEGVPRTSIAWRLAGIVDHVMDYGAVDPTRDAFQNWAGFYILIAFITEVTGIESPLRLAAWAHVLFNLLYLGPLLLLLSAATKDRRLIWLGIWVFYLSNWIGQDYLAPQAFGYFFYLITLAILLNWFRGGSGVWEVAKTKLKFLPPAPVAYLNKWFAPEIADEGQGKQQAGLLILIVVFMIVLVSSHQLSPIAVLAAVTTLVVFGRITPRGLPLIIAILVGTWISFMAISYLSGHVEVFTEPLGALSSNVDDNVTDRLRGSPAHIFVVRFRIYFTLLIWILAVLGGVRRHRSEYFDLNFALLAIVPFSLLALQTYGGELLLRTYLFSLPFAAFFMAALFYSRPDTGRSWVTLLAIIILSGALCVGFFFSRYGNERMDYFTVEEVEAANYLYAIAEPGSHIVAGTETLPWRFEGYNTYQYSSLESVVRENNIAELAEIMSREQYPHSYLILTRSQKASGELFIGWPLGTWERFENTVLESDLFTTIFANDDAKIFVLTSSVRAAD